MQRDIYDRSTYDAAQHPPARIGEYEAQQEEAILFHYEGGHDDDECSADLIAAAPELLAFVQKVAGHYEGTESGDEADRLVSKATGNA